MMEYLRSHTLARRIYIVVAALPVLLFFIAKEAASLTGELVTEIKENW